MADTKSGLRQFFFDLSDVFEIARFDVDPKEAADDRASRLRVLVVYARDVCAAAGDDLRNFHELTGFVEQFDIQRALPSAHDQPAHDDAVHDRNVDVSAGNQTAHFFAFQFGEFPREYCGERRRARAFGNDFFFFDQRENGGCDLVVVYRYDPVHVFFTVVERAFA